MPNETSAIKAATRRVKAKTLEIAESVLNDPEHKAYSKEMYETTYQTALRNSIPQTREITGDEGGPIEVTLLKYADTTSVAVQPPPVSNPDNQSI